jgi:hypothetical protein
MVTERRKWLLEDGHCMICTSSTYFWDSGGSQYYSPVNKLWRRNLLLKTLQQAIEDPAASY